MQTLGREPINGLRHPTSDDANGWYIWAGENLGGEPDFFQSVHTEHLLELLPQVIAYLGLAPGWRFLLADGQEDVWFDQSLLETP